MKSTNPPPEVPGGTTSEESQDVVGSTPAVRRANQTPRITAHGPMVRIALGGTPGSGDSGMPTLQRVDS